MSGLSAGNVSGNSTTYLPLGASAQSTTEGNVVTPFTAGTLSNLSIKVGATPSGGDSWTMTVRKNNVATALTCTVASGTSTCTSAASVVFVAGDLISLQVIGSVASREVVEVGR